MALKFLSLTLSKSSASVMVTSSFPSVRLRWLQTCRIKVDQFSSLPNNSAPGVLALGHVCLGGHSSSHAADWNRNAPYRSRIQRLRPYPSFATPALAALVRAQCE